EFHAVPTVIWIVIILLKCLIENNTICEMKEKLKIGIIRVPLFYILCCMLLFNTANAANRIRVATIGERTPTLDKNVGYQKMVDQMIAFWKRELDQVIHDDPDLIVLPENADFPWGLTRA